MNTLTIPKNLVKNSDLVVLGKSDYEKLAKENTELRMAVAAIVDGELALRQGKTRAFKDFLESKTPRSKHVKGF